MRVLLAFVIFTAVTACIDTRAPQPLHPLLQGLPRPIIVAHRGGGGERPEHTLPTYQELLTLLPGVIVELDVRRTKDGKLVVFHDEHIDRIVGEVGQARARSIHDHDLMDLRAMDAARCFSPVDGGTASPRDCFEIDSCTRFPFRRHADTRCGARVEHLIPELHEALKLIPDDAVIMLEVKDSGIEQQVAEELDAHHDPRRVIVGSFNDESARVLQHTVETAAKDRFGARVPLVVPLVSAICRTLSYKTGSYWPACLGGDVLAIPPKRSGVAFDTRELIEDAHRDGMAVFYWTVNDPEEIVRLARIGADGIITDFPRLAVEALENARREGLLP